MAKVEERGSEATPKIMILWQRLPVWFTATLSGVFVSSVGVFTWAIASALIPAPWSVVVMGIFLWLYLKYFSGNWWPKSTASARRLAFRAIELPRDVWKWSLLCALIIVALWQSSLVVTFRLIQFPGDAFTAGYNLAGLPIWILWLMVIMAALVAGVCEETGYRGYMQAPLENQYGAILAIALVSIVFVFIHLPQLWAPPLLLHLFAVSVLFGILAHTSGSIIPGMLAHFGLDIFNFSYWWTDLAGRYDHQPISKTGLDGHFAAWAFFFVVSAGLFFWAIGKVRLARQAGS